MACPQQKKVKEQKQKRNKQEKYIQKINLSKINTPTTNQIVSIKSNIVALTSYPEKVENEENFSSPCNKSN
jgi:hypothetical protein